MVQVILKIKHLSRKLEKILLILEYSTSDEDFSLQLYWKLNAAFTSAPVFSTANAGAQSKNFYLEALRWC